MSIQSTIASVFAGRAFLRPLFYSYPGGLRFELSERGSFNQQFLTAQQKASQICSDLFNDGELPTVCLRLRLQHRSQCAELWRRGAVVDYRSFAAVVSAAAL